MLKIINMMSQETDLMSLEPGSVNVHKRYTIIKNIYKLFPKRLTKTY